jgi:hypothetical protein
MSALGDGKQYIRNYDVDIHYFHLNVIEFPSLPENYCKASFT